MMTYSQEQLYDSLEATVYHSELQIVVASSQAEALCKLALTPMAVPPPTDFWSAKYKLWKDQPDNTMLWEILLRCEDGTAIRASSADLAAWSSYFAALFTGGFIDSINREVALKDVSGPALTAILDGMYGDKDIALTPSNLCPILAAADMLQLVEGTRQCEAYMVGHMEPSCAPDFHILADKHALLDLKTRTLDYMHKHLPEVLRDEKGEDDFLRLPTEIIVGVLKAGGSKWQLGTYLLDLYDRLRPAGISEADLFDCTRLDRCSSQQLADLLAHPVVAGNASFLSRIAAVAVGRLDSQQQSLSQEFVPNMGYQVQVDGYKVAVSWQVKPWSEKKDETSAIFSPNFYIPGRAEPWKLELHPKGSKQAGTHLSFYLVPDANEIGEEELDYKLWLLNNNGGSAELGQELSCKKKFASKGVGWGFSEFVALSKLEDAAEDWIQDDSLVFAVTYKP